MFAGQNGSIGRRGGSREGDWGEKGSHPSISSRSLPSLSWGKAEAGSKTWRRPPARYMMWVGHSSNPSKMCVACHLSDVIG